MRLVCLALLISGNGVRAVEAVAANQLQHALNGNTVIPSGIARRVPAPRVSAALASADFGFPGTTIDIDAWGRGKVVPTVTHLEPGVQWPLRPQACDAPPEETVQRVTVRIIGQ